ncbi:MAG: DUF6252 family protein [Vicinamibacterales bacterium]
MNPRPLFGLAILALLAVSCGDSATQPTVNNSVKVLTANVNNINTVFTATVVSGTFFNGNLIISGNDGSRTLLINAGNVAGTGTITLGNPNQWNALAQVIDGTGTFSTGFLGGSGSVTLTTATLSRITGTFNFIAYTTQGTGQGAPVRTIFNGVFDISNP